MTFYQVKGKKKKEKHMKPFFPQIASGTYHLHVIGNYVRDVQGWRYQILLGMVEGNQVPNWDFRHLIPSKATWDVLISCFLYYRYCVKTFQGHREWVRKVRVSPDGKLCNHSDVFCIHNGYMLLSWPKFCCYLISFKLVMFFCQIYKSNWKQWKIRVD